jgi:hypothetical protein
MCVFICANPVVNDWVTKVTARSQRSSVLTPSSVASNSMTNGKVDESDWPVSYDAATRRSARDAMLRECEWRRRDAASLASEWKNTFEKLTEAWSRLLGLIGLRR